MDLELTARAQSFSGRLSSKMVLRTIKSRRRESKTHSSGDPKGVDDTPTDETKFIL